MYRILLTFFTVSFLASCENLQQDFENIFEKQNNLNEIDLTLNFAVRTLSADTKTWNDVVTNSAEILAAEIAILDAKREAEVIATAKELQVNSSLQAGSMSISDEKNGALGTLNVDQLISDFGQTDSKIMQANANVELASLNYLNTIDNQLLQAALALNAWEAGYELMNLTYSKQVLAAPLVDNLRRLASAGQIDSIQLATAEQSLAQLELTNVQTRKAINKAEVTIKKYFNKSPDKLNIDLQDLGRFVGKLEKFTPSRSLTYRLTEQRKTLADLSLLVHKSSDKGSLVARSKIDVPAASNMDADASVGFVYSKNLRDGGRHEKITQQLETKIRQAEADLTAVSVELKTRNSDLRMEKSYLKSASQLRLELIANVEDQISQLEDQLSIGSTSFNELLSAHIELYQLQRDEIEASSELSKVNLELIALHDELRRFFKIKLTTELKI